jgi:hypothetical protein
MATIRSLLFVFIVIALGMSGCASQGDTSPEMKLLTVSVSWKEVPNSDPAEYYISSFTTGFKGSWKEPKTHKLGELESFSQALPKDIMEYYYRGVLKEGERIIVRIVDGETFIDMLAEVRKDEKGVRYVHMIR